MAVCLLPNKVEAFKKALKERKINIADLLKMTTEARTKMLEQYAGKNAADVNLLFERKLILKNKMLGIKNWASKVGEVGRYSPKKAAEIKALMEKYKKAQEERTFSPKEEEAFLNSLADAKLGVHISEATAKTIFDLTTKVENLKSKYNPETGEWSSPEAQAKYGANKVIMERFIESLKTENLTVKEMLLTRYYEGRRTFEENKAKAATDLINDTANILNDNAIAFKASWDNSFMGRQGTNVLKTNPSIWWKMVKNSFSDFYKGLIKKDGGNMAKDSLMAEVFGRENYINGKYEKAKLIPRAEEQFPTTLPERIPVLGRAFSASEAAFTNSAIRARIDLFDKFLELAKEQGEDINSADLLSDAGKSVGSLTARGTGRTTTNPLVKLILWAPRMLKANLDVLTAHGGGAGLKTKFARKQARINLIKIVATTGLISAIANAISPGSSETNPLSSDFQRIKTGDTRIDTTGGGASIITLLARLLTMQTKSSVTGITTDLNSGKFGSKTGFDIGIDFLANKTTPFTGALIDFLDGKDFDGRKPTLTSTATSLSTPISIENFVDTFYGKDSDFQITQLVGDMLDVIGISSNTYTASENWNTKDTKEIEQFRKEVEEKEFKKANQEYNRIIGREISELTKTKEYENLSDDDKFKEIQKIKKNAKKYIFNKYNP